MVYEFTQSKVMRWFISIVVVVVYSIYRFRFQKERNIFDNLTEYHMPSTLVFQLSCFRPIIVFHTFSELKAAIYPYLFMQ